MAILQREFPRTFERPAARPVLLPEARVRRRVASRGVEAAHSHSMLAFAVAAASLVMYISGYARMTGVNYQHVKIRHSISTLESQHQLLATELIRRSHKEAVEAWASSNHMAPPSIPAVVLHPATGGP